MPAVPLVLVWSWSRMVGSMAQDAIAKVDSLKAPPAQVPAVKIRCRACGALCEETANSVRNAPPRCEGVTLIASS